MLHRWCFELFNRTYRMCAYKHLFIVQFDQRKLLFSCKFTKKNVKKLRTYELCVPAWTFINKRKGFLHAHTIICRNVATIEWLWDHSDWDGISWI